MAQLGIESVLVAGRGPAACAVITALTRLGVKAVAVHSEAERSARHVRLADDAVLLGPAPASGVLSRGGPHRRGRRPQRRLGRPPVPPPLAGNARLAAAVSDAGLHLGRSRRRRPGAARWGRRRAGQRTRSARLGHRRWPAFPDAGDARPRSRHRPGVVDAGRAARRAPAGAAAGRGGVARAGHRGHRARRRSWPRSPPGSPWTSPSSSARTVSTPSSSHCAAPLRRPRADRRRRAPDPGPPSPSSCGPPCRRARPVASPAGCPAPALVRSGTPAWTSSPSAATSPATGSTAGTTPSWRPSAPAARTRPRPRGPPPGCSRRCPDTGVPHDGPEVLAVLERLATGRPILGA